jgi:hypothetical protein
MTDSIGMALSRVSKNLEAIQLAFFISRINSVLLLGIQAQPLFIRETTQIS